MSPLPSPVALTDGARPRDIAVLARSNAEIEPLARALRMRGVPVRTQLRSDFFAQAEVRPLLAYLRVVVDPHNTLELYTLATGFPYELGGEHLTDVLSRARRRHQSLWQALTEPEDRTTWPVEFAAGVARLMTDVRAGIELGPERSSTEASLRLRAPQRSPDPAGGVCRSERGSLRRSFLRDRSISCSSALSGSSRVPGTASGHPHRGRRRAGGHRPARSRCGVRAHRPPGEGPRIPRRPSDRIGGRPLSGARQAAHAGHAVGRDSGPSRHSESDRLDEERRLCFVAMTRARDELWLSYHVLGPGGRGRRRPSPFVGETLDSPSAASASRAGRDRTHRDARSA